MAGTLVKSVMLKIVSNDGETEAKLDLITKKANELGRLHPDIKVKVDSAAASAKLAVLRKELKDTGNAAAGDTGTSLKSRLMSLGSAAAVAGGFGGVSKDASLATKVMSGFSLATGLLEAPMAGAIVGVGGLASGLAAAGMGLLAFGAVAKSQYTVASTAAGQVQTAQDAYTVAIAHGTSQAKAYKAEQIAIAKADVEMTPAQIQLSKSIGGAQNAWQSFVQSNTKGVATIMTQGIGLMPKVFASMQPFMAPTEKALGGLITQLGKGLDSSGFKSFIDVMAKNSGPAITKLGQSIGHIVVGLGGIIKAFMPMAQTVMGGLDKITGKFATWGTTLSSHSGFQSLMSMAKTDMPYVIGIVKNLGGAIMNLGSSTSGLPTLSNSKSPLHPALPLSPPGPAAAAAAEHADEGQPGAAAVLLVRPGRWWRGRQDEARVPGHFRWPDRSRQGRELARQVRGGRGGSGPGHEERRRRDQDLDRRPGRVRRGHGPEPDRPGRHRHRRPDRDHRHLRNQIQGFPHVLDWAVERHQIVPR